MAETKFDYNSVSSVYGQMKNINENIKTLFEDIDKEMESKIQVEDEAVYGELGAQLLLSWDNISGCFPEFVNNFDNWSYLVASASGDYSQFESDVQAFKNANPLGVKSGGRTSSFIADSQFANALTQQELDDYASQAQFYELTGATYIDTGMVSYLKKQDILEGIGLALDFATIIGGTVSVCRYAKIHGPILKWRGSHSVKLKDGSVISPGSSFDKRSITAIRKEVGAGRVNAISKFQGTKFYNSKFYQSFRNTKLGGKIAFGVEKGIFYGGGEAAYMRNLLSTKPTLASAGAKLTHSMSTMNGSPALVYTLNTLNTGANASHVKTMITGDDAASYATGNGFAIVAGDEVKVNGNSYNFLGQSSSGTNVYADSNGNLVYDKGDGTVGTVSVKNSSGSYVTATMNNVDEDSELSINGASLGSYDSFSMVIDGTPTEDFDGYYDNISSNINNINEKNADNAAATN